MWPLSVGSSSEMQDPEGVLGWLAIVRAAEPGDRLRGIAVAPQRRVCRVLLGES